MANEKKIDYAILGLLSHDSLTGYQIKKRIDTSLRFFWGASYGSIYPTLSALEKQGYVTSCKMADSGRDKNVYTITEAGREYLREWLVLPVTKDEIRYETLLKLFFGNEVGSTETLHHIEEFEKKIGNDLPMLKQSVNVLEQIKDTDKSHLYYLLTAKFGVEIYETYLTWCKEAKEILEKE